MAERTPSTPRTGSLSLSVVQAAAAAAAAATTTATATTSLVPLAAAAAAAAATVGSVSAAADTHPVEVVGRIRQHPDGRGEPSVLQALPNGRDLRIASKEHQQGYRVFSLDGVSEADSENLESFYLRYAEARVDDVKLGGKCTIMMYGPTGAGKSHTMFGGSGSERGVAYHALMQIMGESLLDGKGRGPEVRATVWEIFNEEIYDLLAQTSNPSGSLKGQANRVRLEVKGKKVRNSIYINGDDPNRLLKEIQKVEKKRVTKSTSCNDRSSRSHCVVTFEVPAVDGRLVLVDMAGSENIEQAGVGIESKMQTGKINQGNGALKRVVEAIANGESHIPYRDSKLTMILQESFEDKNAKVLMILCASPDPRDLYKTLGTFEYGAKAKRIVRLPNSPARERIAEEELQKLAVVNAKELAKDACIVKLRREKEKSDRERDLRAREASDLRARVQEIESRMNAGKSESDKELVQYRKQAGVDSESTRKRVEELERKLRQKEEELKVERLRADRAETELTQLKRNYFSHLENDPESADWGSVKHQQQQQGRGGEAGSWGTSTGMSPASSAVRAEKIRGLGPLILQDHNSKSSAAALPSPKEKKEKKFSSSVLSFFKGGGGGSDSSSAHGSKKSSSSHGKMEVKFKESPSPHGSSHHHHQFHHLQQLQSPKSSGKSSDRKRQAGAAHDQLLLPSPRSCEKGPDKKRQQQQHQQEAGPESKQEKQLLSSLIPSSPRASEKSSERKRQAGQEAPSPNSGTAEKKRHTTAAGGGGGGHQDGTLSWHPSTLHDLLKVRDEEQQQKQSQQLSDVDEAKTPSPEDDYRQNWFKNLSAQFSDHKVNNPEFSIRQDDSAQSASDRDVNEISNPQPQEQQRENAMMLMSNMGEIEDEMSRLEKDPLGLGTWSESKLHRKGWLPIIVEEKEEELERLARKSLEEAAKNRRHSSCPRLRDSGSSSGANSSQQTLNRSGFSTNTPNLTRQNSGEAAAELLPSNLSRDKFSPMARNKDNDPSSRIRLDEDQLVTGVRGTPGSDGAGVGGGGNAGTPIDSFLQRLYPAGRAEAAGPHEPEVAGPEMTTLPRLRRSMSSPGPARDSQSPEDEPEEAASARKARIENIFMLCGHRREVAARHGGADSPAPGTPSVAVAVSSPIQGRRETTGPTNITSSNNGAVVDDPYHHQREHRRESSGLLSVLSHATPSSPFSDSASILTASPVPSFRERDNQSHLSLELDAYYSPARSPFRSSLSADGHRLRSPVSPDLGNSASSSPLLPVLPSPQKSDSPSRYHRKFRNGNLFPYRPDEFGPKLPSSAEASAEIMENSSGGAGSTMLSTRTKMMPPATRQPIVSSHAFADENVEHNIPPLPVVVPVAATTAAVVPAEHTNTIQSCEVYVKWESKDSSGKLICILTLPKGASLADLRREIVPHIPAASAAREGFTFLMLGDAGGAPVEQELESDLRISSLPDCPGSKGTTSNISCRLASLRPPVAHKVYTTPSSRPFRPIENTLSGGGNNNTPEYQSPAGGKLSSKAAAAAGTGSKQGNLPGGRSALHQHHQQTTPGSNNSNSSSLVKGLRTLATGVAGLRGGQSLKEKGSSTAVQEIASRVLT